MPSATSDALIVRLRARRQSAARARPSPKCGERRPRTPRARFQSDRSLEHSLTPSPRQRAGLVGQGLEVVVEDEHFATLARGSSWVASRWASS